MSWGIYGYQTTIGRKQEDEAKAYIGSHHPPFGRNFEPTWQKSFGFSVTSPAGMKWWVEVYDADSEVHACHLVKDLTMWQRAARRNMQPSGSAYAPEIRDDSPSTSEEEDGFYPLSSDWKKFSGCVRLVQTHTR